MLANAAVVDLNAEAPDGEHAVIEVHQRDQEFQPRFSIVEVGSSVSFPNHDKSRHHVYSFSPAKSFEIKLYKGVPADPVLFDQAGLVALGCNLHDWMIGYIYVVNSTSYTLTDDNGRATIVATAPALQLSVAHPFAAGSFEPIVVDASRESVELTVKLRDNVVLPTRPEPKERRRRR